jgi:5-methylcytosine-specific restriction endonuclease McrA
MSAAMTRRRILWAAATDSTFEPAQLDGRTVLMGKCIHCNRKLVVELDGVAVGRVTVEHIVPRHHGGDDAVENLALACARCNAGKGVRHDLKRKDDPGLRHVVETLQARRKQRMRAPLELRGLDLPPPPATGS